MKQQSPHISIPALLEIGSGVLNHLGILLEKHDFHRILVFYDSFTYQHLAKKVNETLKNSSVETLELPSEQDVNDLFSLAFSLKPYDVIVAVGGGAVIDYGKYIAFCRKIPFVSIPTSASNDGFASSNCSLIVGGKKTTVPARIPYGIVVDLDIIQTAPDKMILAGIGDLMSNITALYDWQFEEDNGKGHVNAFASMLSKKAVNSFIRTPMTNIKEPLLLKELISSMTMSGISTEISGNSAPVSGSEHLISHALDQIAEKPQMHGVQVGVATYLMAKVQNHRFERIYKVFERTGFFNYVKLLSLNKNEYIHAIDLAPSIKPDRYTFLHEAKYREEAKKLLNEDETLSNLFHR